MALSDVLQYQQPSVDVRLAAQDLYSRYNLAVDLGDVDAWVAAFTPDGQFVVDGHAAWAHEAQIPAVDLRGHAALRGFMTDVTEERHVRHWTNNLVLRLEGNGRLHGLSLMTVWDLSRPRAGEVVLTGVMRDVLEPAGDGSWVYRRRHLRLDK